GRALGGSLGAELRVVLHGECDQLVHGPGRLEYLELASQADLPIEVDAHGLEQAERLRAEQVLGAEQLHLGAPPLDFRLLGVEGDGGAYGHARYGEAEVLGGALELSPGELDAVTGAHGRQVAPGDLGLQVELGRLDACPGGVAVRPFLPRPEEHVSVQAVADREAVTGREIGRRPADPEVRTREHAQTLLAGGVVSDAAPDGC